MCAICMQMYSAYSIAESMLEQQLDCLDVIMYACHHQYRRVHLYKRVIIMTDMHNIHTVYICMLKGGLTNGSTVTSVPRSSNRAAMSSFCFPHA